MQNSNYINIQGWMVTGLKLSGNNLLTYALIYGFSQDGNSEFTGSINYVCKWLGCTRNTAIKALKELTELKLVDKIQVEVNNVTFNKYSANLEIVKATLKGGSAETAPPVQNVVEGSANIARGGSAETAPNNTNINNTTNIYTETEFLEDWSRCREVFRKLPTNIKGLKTFDQVTFNKLKKDWSREEFREAMRGLFMQEVIKYSSMITQPSHFLENMEKYYNAFISKDFKQYGSKQVQH